MSEIRVGLDLDRDGTIEWAGPDNITQYVKGFSTMLGTKSSGNMVSDGAISLTINNYEGLFNPENSNGITSGDILPGMRVEIWVKNTVDVWSVLWVGQVSEIGVPTGTRNHTVTMSGNQAFSRLNKEDISSVGVQLNKTVSELIEILAGYYQDPGQPGLIIGAGRIGDVIGSNVTITVDTEGITVPVFAPSLKGPFRETTHEAGTQDVLSILKQLSAADNGFLYWDEGCSIVYKSFSSLVGSEDKILDLDADAQSTIYEVVSLADRLFTNSAQLMWYEWEYISNGYITTVDNEQTLGPGKSLSVKLAITDDVLIDEVTTISVSSSGGTLSSPTWTFLLSDNTLTVTVTNSHVSDDATITGYDIYGNGAIKSGAQTYKSINADSVLTIGKFHKDIENPYIQTLSAASSYTSRKVYLGSSFISRITSFTVLLERDEDWHDTALIGIGSKLKLSVPSVSHEDRLYYVTGKAVNFKPGTTTITFYVQPQVGETFFTIGSAIGGPKVLL